VRLGFEGDKLIKQADRDDLLIKGFGLINTKKPKVSAFCCLIDRQFQRRLTGNIEILCAINGGATGILSAFGKGTEGIG